MDDDSVERNHAAARLGIAAAARLDLRLELFERAGEVARLVELASSLVAERGQILEGRIGILERVADRHAIGPYLPACRNRHGNPPLVGNL